jgi:hypothetical protein
VVVGEAMVVYGPPLTVERFTVLLVAPAAALHDSVTVPLPTVAASPVGAGGEESPLPDGITSSVMLCDGTVVVMALLETVRSVRRAIAVCEAELICQACAVRPSKNSPGSLKGVDIRHRLTQLTNS